MPHKHKRRGNDKSNTDLPPTSIAKPLPVRKTDGAKTSAKDGVKKRKTKRSGTSIADDTPKAFLRLMQLHKQGKMPSGLDDGTTTKDKKNRKRKRGEGESSKPPGSQDSKSHATATGAAAAIAPSTQQIPKILPGEKMSDFAARVNMALPLSGIAKSSRPTGTDKDGSKLREERQTKHERRLLRLQREWREEEKKIREREEAAREEAEEAIGEEVTEQWRKWDEEAGVGKKKKAASSTKKKKKNGLKPVDGTDAGVDDDDSDGDPWAVVNQRARASTSQPIVNPLSDVAQAPPSLVVPKEKFKVRGGAKVDVADVPVAAGSLRRREELAAERKNIVQEYRRLMADKRN